MMGGWVDESIEQVSWVGEWVGGLPFFTSAGLLIRASKEEAEHAFLDVIELPDGGGDGLEG